MAQYDVHVNLSPKSSKSIPYLLEIQGSTFVDVLATCVIIPLVAKTTEGDFKPATILNPEIEVLGKTYYLSPAEITTVLRSNLGPRVANVKDYAFAIKDALDRLLT